MRSSLVLLTLLSWSSICLNVFSQETDKSAAIRARVALSLSQAKHKAKRGACHCDLSCDCSCSNCQCTFPGECGSSTCTCGLNTTAQSPGPLEWVIFEAQYSRALKAQKPLLIWVGETCPACENQWTDYIHARLTEYRGEKGPEVIVGKPDTLGFSVVGRFNGIPRREQVAAALGVLTKVSATASPDPLPLFIPQFIPQFIPMMGGGGGGGGGGGRGC